MVQLLFGTTWLVIPLSAKALPAVPAISANAAASVLSFIHSISSYQTNVDVAFTNCASASPHAIATLTKTARTIQSLISAVL
jgi:hypothetical protein